jgi:hypothetical protein
MPTGPYELHPDVHVLTARPSRRRPSARGPCRPRRDARGRDVHGVPLRPAAPEPRALHARARNGDRAHAVGDDGWLRTAEGGRSPQLEIPAPEIPGGGRLHDEGRDPAGPGRAARRGRRRADVLRLPPGRRRLAVATSSSTPASSRTRRRRRACPTSPAPSSAWPARTWRAPHNPRTSTCSCTASARSPPIGATDPRPPVEPPDRSPPDRFAAGHHAFVLTRLPICVFYRLFVSLVRLMAPSGADDRPRAARRSILPRIEREAL